MTTREKWMLTLLIVIGVSGALTPYVSSEESYKYVPAVLRFWIIFALIGASGGAIAAKAFFTEVSADKGNKDVVTTVEETKVETTKTTEPPAEPKTP